MDRQFELTITHAKQFERFFGWPVLVIFLISFIVMLRTQATWVIPVMLVVSIGMAYKGYMEYRVIRPFAEHQNVVRVLRYRIERRNGKSESMHISQDYQRMKRY